MVSYRGLYYQKNFPLFSFSIGRLLFLLFIFISIFRTIIFILIFYPASYLSFFHLLLSFLSKIFIFMFSPLGLVYISKFYFYFFGFNFSFLFFVFYISTKVFYSSSRSSREGCREHARRSLKALQAPREEAFEGAPDLPLRNCLINLRPRKEALGGEAEVAGD